MLFRGQVFRLVKPIKFFTKSQKYCWLCFKKNVTPELYNPPFSSPSWHFQHGAQYNHSTPYRFIDLKPQYLTSMFTFFLVNLSASEVWSSRHSAPDPQIHRISTQGQPSNDPVRGDLPRLQKFTNLPKSHYDIFNLHGLKMAEHFTSLVYRWKRNTLLFIPYAVEIVPDLPRPYRGGCIIWNRYYQLQLHYY